MRDETKAVHLGRHPERFSGAVNTPVFRASTILAENVAQWEQKKKDRAQEKPGTYYGLMGTPTKHLLEEAHQLFTHLGLAQANAVERVLASC